MERKKQIEDYVNNRADIVYGKNPSKDYLHRKEEYIRQLIKKNMRGAIAYGRGSHCIGIAGGSVDTDPKTDLYGVRVKGVRPLLGETTATHSHHGFAIQSVLIPKDKFTRDEAIKYIKKHFQYKKIDSTQRPNFYSFRQFDPTKNSKYFTKILDNGVELVFEKKPIGPDSIKPRVMEEGGSLSINEIYKFIENGYEWPELKSIPQYKLIKNLSDNFHQVYENKPQKRIIINYTGTKGIIDWLNNLDYILQTYTLWPRFKNAKEVLDKVLKQYPNYKITLVSHSQGGIITRELSRLYGDELFEIISLNPGGMSFIEGVKSAFGEGKRKREKEYTIKSEFDFASFFANVKNGKNNIIIPRESGDLGEAFFKGFIVKEHSPKILFRLNPDLEIGRK